MGTKTDGVPLIIGGDSRIGGALMRAFEATGVHATDTTRRPDGRHDRALLDLRAVPAEWMPPHGVSVAYLCAGETAVAACDAAPERTAAVNVTGSVEIARRLHAQGVHVVYLSTNLVFDGCRAYPGESDAPAPRSEYGRQKLRGEREILALGGLVTVVRFTKVLGPAAPLFMKWRELLTVRQPVNAFTDLVIAPVSLKLAVEALVRVWQRRVTGIVHVSGARDVAYFDIAMRMSDQLAAPRALVRGCHTTNAGLVAGAVPQHTALGAVRMRAELDLLPPEWEPVVDQACAPLTGAVTRG